MTSLALLVFWSLASAKLAAGSAGSVPSVRAAAFIGRLTLDGRLDESGWQQLEVLTEFVQVEPEGGTPASQDTAVRVGFTPKFLLVGVVCHDTKGSTGVRVSDLRRDFDERQSDYFSVVLDPFGNKRTAQVFSVNPAGARRDVQVRDGRQVDADWNALWHAASQRNVDGWSAELAIPWASLRYPPDSRRWQVNFVRHIRRREETSAWVPYPRNISAFDTAYTGTLGELAPPPPSFRMEWSPYALWSGARSAPSSRERRESGFELGGDAKWLASSATTVDLTLNTDFAQAEADREVVNLSRFSVRFPEKRPFFLENSALFDSGRPGLKPFYSRRIGLDEDGAAVPMEAGLRAIYRGKDRSAGAMVVRLDEEGVGGPSTVAVGRYLHNFGERSRAGVLLTHRTLEAPSGQSVADVDNTVWQLDGLWRPNERVSIDGLVSGSATSGAGGDGLAASVTALFETPRVYVGWTQELVTEDYRADAGFLSDRNVILSNPEVTFDLRPQWLPKRIRSFRPTTFASVYHSHGDRQFREGSWRLEPVWFVWNNGAEVWSWFEFNRQNLETTFQPLPELTVEPGRYRYERWGIAGRTDRSRRLSGELRWIGGGFFDGQLDRWVVRGRVAPSPRFALAVRYDRNELRGIGSPQRDGNSSLFTPELRVALNPRLGATVLFQRNTAASRTSWYGRVSWEWRPQSFVYVVYTRNETMTPEGAFSGPTTGDQLIVKLTWTGLT